MIRVTAPYRNSGPCMDHGQLKQTLDVLMTVVIKRFRLFPFKHVRYTKIKHLKLKENVD